MDLKEINYLLTIQKCGSITKAAEELFISQPALSKYLKGIEHQVGAQLFSRIGKELVPTYIGSRYLAYAAKIAHLQSDWNTERRDLLGEEKGVLSLAMPPMRSACIMPHVLPIFYEKYPHVKVVIMEESHLVKKHWMTLRDEIDIVIYSDTSPQSALMHENLGVEEVVLIMSKEHPLAKRGKARPGCRYPWFDLSLLREEAFALNPADQTTGKISGRLLDAAGIDPNVLLYTFNTEIPIHLAIAGTVVAFAPETYVKKLDHQHRLQCFSVGTHKTETMLFALYEKGRYLPAYTKYFFGLVREHMASI